MATTKLNFNTPLLSMRGEPAKDEKGNELTLGKIIADHIGSAASDKQVVKLYGWATSMYRGEDLILDSEDRDSLKKFIELLPNSPVFVKAQALEVFSKSSE